MSSVSRKYGVKGAADLMNPFMAIGDSITAGFGPTPPANGAGGYRTKLTALARIPMQWIGRNFDFLWHEGYNGQRCDQVIPTVLPMLPIMQPRNLCLTLGVNDINQGESTSATLTEVLAACNSLLAAGDPYLQHVFVSTIPIGATMSSLGGGAYNTGMAAAFAGCDARIILVDACSTLAPPGDFSDGLHPNDGGYTTMAAAWYAALQAVYPAL